MAGGNGTRFWPLSRQNIPKQLLNLSGHDTLINDTIKRVESMISLQNTFIITNKLQLENLKNILIPGISQSNILVEPVARNTASCILYASMKIYEQFGDGVMCIFPSDQYITNNTKFRDTLEIAIKIAEETDSLITIGIKPTFPSTGYGYIKIGNKLSNYYKVDRFIEKPNLEQAKEYLNLGKYYWNSGIFIWKISVIIDNFKRFLPRLYNQLYELSGKFKLDGEIEMIEKIYPNLDNISIDYGIMERTDDALVVLGDFGWNDMGSWDALGTVFPLDEHSNIVKAEHINIDTEKCIIYGDNKLIATIGLENIVIVDTKDALMVCSKNRTQDVKKVIDKLRQIGRQDLL